MLGNRQFVIFCIIIHGSSWSAWNRVKIQFPHTQIADFHVVEVLCVINSENLSLKNLSPTLLLNLQRHLVRRHAYDGRHHTCHLIYTTLPTYSNPNKQLQFPLVQGSTNLDTLNQLSLNQSCQMAVYIYLVYAPVRLPSKDSRKRS